MPNRIRNNNIIQQVLRKPPCLKPHEPFPPVEQALGRMSGFPGLLATGGVADKKTLESAYRQGIFPWPHYETHELMWFSTHPRMVLRPEDFRLHPSLRKTIRRFRNNAACSVRIDTAFAEVLHQCATITRHGEPGSWLTPELQQAYIQLHQHGMAHSMETWIDGELVGGLYCVNIGRLVSGESMFAHQRDASKIALAALICLCRAHDVEYIDCQQETPHLASLGARPIHRQDYLQSIARTQHLPTMYWQFDDSLWNHILPVPQGQSATTHPAMAQQHSQ